jgi:protocatechuate 3,4-dioxygenase beta subunit
MAMLPPVRHDQYPASGGRDLEDDDRPIGRVLTRREVLILLGAGGTAVALAACAPGVVGTSSPPASTEVPASADGAAATTSTASGSSVPACVVRPELTEGPYFVDERLERSDIRSDPSSAVVSEGATLDLTFAVSRIEGGACVPFEGALVDVWHCDAGGTYSDVDANGTVGQKFLRGYLVTDAEGRAPFTTIYPGWYQGRTVHIHFKIRTDATGSSGLEFTSQLFFDDSLTDSTFESEPYASRGERTTRNGDDNIFAQSGGVLTLALTGDAGAGYATTFVIGVETS